MSKGSARRPADVDAESFAERWERTFVAAQPAPRDGARDAVSGVASGLRYDEPAGFAAIREALRKPPPYCADYRMEFFKGTIGSNP